MPQITTKSKYGQQHFEVYDKCLGWLLAFMQLLLHSVAFCSSTVVVGTLRLSLSSCIPYQCICCSTTRLHCNHSSMVQCCCPCRLWILAFCPPPPTLTVGFISIYNYFFLLINFFIYVFLHSAIWLLCDSAHRGLVQDACGWIAGWAGQSGVQAPKGATVVSAPRSPKHVASICDVGINRD